MRRVAILNESERLMQARKEFVSALLDTAIGKALIRIVEMINKVLIKR